MSHYTGYICDVCGKVDKDPMPYGYNAGYSFEARTGCHVSYWDDACSEECLSKAVKEWSEKRRLDERAEATSTEDIAEKVIDSGNAA